MAGSLEPPLVKLKRAEHHYRLLDKEISPGNSHGFVALASEQGEAIESAYWSLRPSLKLNVSECREESVYLRILLDCAGR
jgi:hypothetical protein